MELTVFCGLLPDVWTIWGVRDPVADQSWHLSSSSSALLQDAHMCKVTRKVGGQPCSDSHAGIVGEMKGTRASSIAGRIFASISFSVRGPQ